MRQERRKRINSLDIAINFLPASTSLLESSLFGADFGCSELGNSTSDHVAPLPNLNRRISFMLNLLSRHTTMKRVMHLNRSFSPRKPFYGGIISWALDTSPSERGKAGTQFIAALPSTSSHHYISSGSKGRKLISYDPLLRICRWSVLAGAGLQEPVLPSRRWSTETNAATAFGVFQLVPYCQEPRTGIRPCRA